MRKSTTYARKRRMNPIINAGEFLNAIERSRAYTDEEIPGGFGGNTVTAANRAELLVRDAAHSLITHQRPLDPEHGFDVLAHAMGVATIRALQINPHEPSNPALPILKEGTLALKRSIVRYRESNAWGMDAKGKTALADAVDVYAAILHASSPAQMAKATEERMKILDRVDDRLKH